VAVCRSFVSGIVALPDGFRALAPADGMPPAKTPIAKKTTKTGLFITVPLLFSTGGINLGICGPGLAFRFLYRISHINIKSQAEKFIFLFYSMMAPPRRFDF
jgi:hypothetical protein